jgi:hypothetical protein
MVVSAGFTILAFSRYATIFLKKNVNGYQNITRSLFTWFADIEFQCCSRSYAQMVLTTRHAHWTWWQGKIQVVMRLN